MQWLEWPGSLSPAVVVVPEEVTEVDVTSTGAVEASWDVVAMDAMMMVLLSTQACA